MGYELNGFYNVDCMDLMKEIPDKYFQLAIVDPPYGIDINMNMGRKRGKTKKHKEKEWDAGIPPQEYFDELERVSQNRIIWGGNYFTEFLGPTRAWIFWDKSVPAELSFADGELAWTNFDRVLRCARVPYNGFVRQDYGGKIHPTQKPIALYEWLLKNYAKEGDKILDTHVGSAGSLIACHNMGFDYMGCELDEDYFRMATERLEAHKAQMRLF